MLTHTHTYTYTGTIRRCIHFQVFWWPHVTGAGQTGRHVQLPNVTTSTWTLTHLEASDQWISIFCFIVYNIIFHTVISLELVMWDGIGSKFKIIMYILFDLSWIVLKTHSLSTKTGHYWSWSFFTVTANKKWVSQLLSWPSESVWLLWCCSPSGGDHWETVETCCAGETGHHSLYQQGQLCVPCPVALNFLKSGVYI